MLFDFFAKIIQTALWAVWIFAYLNGITDKPEVLILSLAAVMQPSYFDYYHLTAGKKKAVGHPDGLHFLDQLRGRRPP